MALPDGIRLDLGRHSRVGITKLTAEEIRVALGLGYARFDVDRRPPRTFVVDVEDVEVRVVGTRFQVERVEGDDREGARVEVSVQRGVVEVRSRREGGELHRLTAGQRFSTPLDPFAEDAVAAPAEAARSAAEGAGGVAGEDGAARPARVARDRARLLFERAQERWRAGRMGDAAAYYEEVLARHPNDPRAGLAALELGRIRMDHLDDLPGAVVSLERAVRLAPSAPFHEDALARLAQANARLGRASECRRARDAYLARYPEGIHAAAVSGACDRGGGSGRR
jgi:tetratricopeptide (TPR) repeat protein